MRAPTIDWEEQAQLLQELEDAVAADPEEVVAIPHRRLPYNVDPVMWTEWSCPTCGSAFRFDLEICPYDGAPLDAVRMSQPFLWLG